MADTVLSLLVKELDQQAKQLEVAMVGGNFKTFEDYKYAAGQYRGLMVARNRVQDLATKLENSDDE